MGASGLIAILALCSAGCTHGAASREPAEPPPAPAPGGVEGQQICGSADAIADLRVELHDGDWGYGSIMVSAWIPKPVEDVKAVLDYTLTSGEARHLDGGIVMDEARRTCGDVVLVGWDLDDFLQVDTGSVTLTDIIYEDGTTDPGPIEAPFEMARTGGVVQSSNRPGGGP